MWSPSSLSLSSSSSPSSSPALEATSSSSNHFVYIMSSLLSSFDVAYDAVLRLLCIVCFIASTCIFAAMLVYISCFVQWVLFRNWLEERTRLRRSSFIQHEEGKLVILNNPVYVHRASPGILSGKQNVVYTQAFSSI